jgi:hypothetical protein
MILLGLAAVLCICHGVRAVAATNYGDPGLTVSQFRKFANSLGSLPGRVEALRLLQEADGRSAVAIATFGSTAGWRLFVFRAFGHGHYSQQWASGRLDDSFAVSSAGELMVFSAGGESLVEFQGCARHVCPDVFSVLLYVPSRRQAFTARSLRGRVTYSDGTELPNNRLYKDFLDQLIRERVK